MPNLLITETAVQIAQSLGQGVHIQNNGTVPVYLDEDSACSSDSFGMKVGAGGTANWPAGKTLWAACAPNESATIALLYGAYGATVTEVSAEITNTVDTQVINPLTVADIVSPVLVQGGGALLVDEIVSPITGGGWGWQGAASIPAAPDGLQYASYEISVEYVGAVSPMYAEVSVVATLSGIVTASTTLAYVAGTGPDWARRHRFVVPNQTDADFAPPYVQVETNVVNEPFRVRVFGYSQAPVTPITRHDEWADRTVLAASGDIWLPPSFATYQVEIRPGAGSTVTGTSGQVLPRGTGTPTAVWAQTHVTPYYVWTAVTIPANGVGIVTVPGNGLAHKLTVTTTGTNVQIFPIP